MSLVITTASLALVAIAHLPSAALSANSALYFEKTAVHTTSEATCIGFARGVSQKQGWTNVHHSAGEVAGETGGAYVSITCVGRGQQAAIAVVMSMANSFAIARQVGHVVAGDVAQLRCIDLPC